MTAASSNGSARLSGGGGDRRRTMNRKPWWWAGFVRRQSAALVAVVVVELAVAEAFVTGEVRGLGRAHGDPTIGISICSSAPAGATLVGGGRVEEDRVGGVGQRSVEIGRPVGDSVGCRDRGETLGIAADQQQTREEPIVAERQTALSADRDQGISQMLGRAMRPVAPLTMIPIVLVAIVLIVGSTVGLQREGAEDADGARIVVDELCYGDRPMSTSRSRAMPRHIVCLTFDFDTQSGFIARGMTTPTPLSRGEFGLLGARRILALLKSRGMPRPGSSPASPSRAGRGMRGGGRARARDRQPQLGAYPSGAA